jgi:hypothetical protein
MGKCTEGMQKMHDESHAENKRVVITVQLQCLAIPDSVRHRRQRGEISTSSVGLVVKEIKVAR